MTRTLVLGAGFGGLTLATELSQRMPEGHEVLLVDRRESFLMGTSKLWLLDGRSRRQDHERRIRDVERHRGVRFLHGSVDTIDVAGKRARVGGEEVAWDQLVLALGAHLDLEAVPGLAQAARSLYSVEGVEALHEDLARFEGGDVLFLVSGMPFKCPPAPYEAAMLAKRYLDERGVAANVTIASPEPQPLPIAGQACGDAVREWVEERGVVARNAHQVTGVDPERKVARFANGEELRFDLLAAVPVHRAPGVLREAGLTNEAGWVPADAATLGTRHADVWAIGDCNAVKLANGKPLVKAGVMAEGEASVVAHNLAARLKGEPEAARFDGKGFCFLELGGGLAVEVRGDFYATPQPVVAAQPPSAQSLELKHAFEAERLQRWFGA